MEAQPIETLAVGGKKMTSTLTADSTNSAFDQYCSEVVVLDWDVDKLTTDHVK